jgi:solute carrier family 25 protein 39/40
VTPLDVVKIRIQAQDKDFMKKKCFIYCNGLMDHLCYCNGNGHNSTVKRSAHGSAAVPPYKWFQRPGQFNGTLDAFAKIIRNEGVLSLWSGLPPTLVMSLPGTMIYFTMYDQFRSYMCRLNGYQKDVPPLWVPTLSGVLARTAACTFVSPLELIRTKMQSRKLTYAEVGQAVRASIAQQGIGSLYRGWSPMIMRDVPFSGLYWLNYEFLKRQFHQPEPGFLFSLSAGAAAGSVAAVITLPFDVVKTHRQIEFGEKELLSEASNSKSNTSTLHIMRQIRNQRGIPGLFSGIVPRLVKVAPACAIMISTYEFGKSFFRRYNSSGMGFFEYMMST